MVLLILRLSNVFYATSKKFAKSYVIVNPHEMYFFFFYEII